MKVKKTSRWLHLRNSFDIKINFLIWWFKHCATPTYTNINFFVACKRKYFIFSLLLLVFNLCNDTILFFNCSCRWKPFLLWFSRLWYFATEGNYRGNSFLHFKELYVSTPLCIEYVCYINSFKVISKKYVQIWCYKKLNYLSCLSTFLDVFVLIVTRED